MTQKFPLSQFSFAGGQVDATFLLRRETKAYYQSARRLYNTWPLLSGGVRRRPGLRHIAVVNNARRIIPYEFSEQFRDIILLEDGGWRVFDHNGFQQSTGTGAPWNDTTIPQLDFHVELDVVFLTHQNWGPRRLTRTAEDVFDIDSVSFPIRRTVYPDGETTVQGRRRVQPHFQPAPGVQMKASAQTGTGITLTTDVDFFVADHDGARIRLEGREVTVTAITNATTATADVNEKLTVDVDEYTTDWTIDAFGAPYGNPACVTFHEGRLCFASTPAAPATLWMSRSGFYYDFDVGTEDDKGIQHTLASLGSSPGVRYVVGGPTFAAFTGLSVMTPRGEDGSQTKPSNFALRPTDAVGCRFVKPILYDGALMFPDQSGAQIRELVVDDNQGFKASSVSLIASSLIRNPVWSTVYRGRAPGWPEQLLLVGNDDGTVAVFHSLRDQDVTHWCLWETPGGTILDGAAMGDKIWFLVQRGSNINLEAMDFAAYLDNSTIRLTPDPIEVEQFAQLADQEVTLRRLHQTQGTYVADAEGDVQIPYECNEVGLGYEGEIDTLPPDAVLFGANLHSKVKRVARMVVSLKDAYGVEVEGDMTPPVIKTVDHPGERFTGEAVAELQGADRSPLYTIRLREPNDGAVLGYTMDTGVPS
jgi:hypothetical protein